MKNNKKTSGVSAEKMVAIGAGAIALAAASFYLFGPEGKHHRKQAKGWMIKAKGEIIEKLEEAKEVSEPVYQSIVDSVTSAYANKNNITADELKEFTGRIRDQWKQISRLAMPKKKSSKK